MADQERVVERTVRVEKGESQTGWVVAVIVLIVVIIGGAYLWTHYRRAPAAQEPNSTNINVTLPAGTTNPGSGSGAAQ